MTDGIFKIKRTVGEKKSLPNIIVEPIEMCAIDKGYYFVWSRWLIYLFWH